MHTTHMIEPIHKIIDEANLANMELEQVIHRYKELITRYEMLMGFGASGECRDISNGAEKQIDELEDILLFFKYMEKYLESSVKFIEDIENFNLDSAKAFK